MIRDRSVDRESSNTFSNQLPIPLCTKTLLFVSVYIHVHNNINIIILIDIVHTHRVGHDEPTGTKKETISSSSSKSL